MRTRSIVTTILAGVSAVAVPAAAMEVARPPRPRVVATKAAPAALVAPKPAPTLAPAPVEPAPPAPKVDPLPAAPTPPADPAPKPAPTTVPVRVATVATTDPQELRLACHAGRPDGAPAVRCEWSPARGAARYDLYRKAADGTATKVYSGGDTAAVDRTVSEGAAYAYGVKAIDAAGRVIGFGGHVRVYCCGGTPPPPEKQELRLACQAVLPDGVPAVRCEWSPATGAVRYDLYRKAADGTATKVYSGGDTTAVDRAVAEGAGHFYGVKAIDAAGGIIGFGGWAQVYCCGGTPPPPEKQELRLACRAGLPDGVATVRCEWSPAAGAVRYDLYRKAPDGTAEKVYSGADTAAADTAVSEGAAFVYGVKAIDAAGRIIGYGAAGPVVCCTILGG